MAKGRFLDELVNFLGDPMFQIPVRTFMDENCLTFDPEEGPTDDHKKIHENYNQLVNELLKAFCDDAGVTVEEGIKAFEDMCTENKELKEYFEVLFDQVMASTDFNIFYGAMAKRNIIIQQQVLVMILAATGSMPSSFSLDEQGSPQKGKGHAESVMISTADDKQEEELLKQVMRASEEDHKRQSALEKKEKEQLERTLELSKAEAQALQAERKHIEQRLDDMSMTTLSAPLPRREPVMSTQKKLEKMTLEGPPPPPPVLAPVSGGRPKPVKDTRPAPGPLKAPAPAAGAAAPDISGSDAASAWLKSAQTEAAKHSAAHAVVAKNMAKMSPEEIKERQAFLNAQRDKLMAMKKQKREDQLQDAVKKQPQRPASARAARNALAGAQSANADDEKAMAMRRAIAEKIKQEVIGK